MNLILHVPDDLASRLKEAGGDLERQALEALVIEAYRAERISFDEVGEALGLRSLNDIDGFLKAHGVYYDYTVEDLERERRALDKFGI